MAKIITVTSPVQGSLKVTDSSASPQSAYYTNLQTATVSGDPFLQTVNVSNSNQQVIVSLPLSQITKISASTQSFGIQWAVDSIAGLIMK